MLEARIAPTLVTPAGSSQVRATAQATRSKWSPCAPISLALSIMAFLNSSLCHGMDGSCSTSNMAMTFSCGFFLVHPFRSRCLSFSSLKSYSTRMNGDSSRKQQISSSRNLFWEHTCGSAAAFCLSLGSSSCMGTYRITSASGGLEARGVRRYWFSLVVAQ